jgi:outer membrane protein insertion porin family
MLGGELYRRDYNSFNYIGNERNTTYSQVSNGGGLRTGFPITEYMSFGTRYSLVADKVTLDKSSFYSDPDGSGPLGLQCDPARAGRYLCDEIGSRLTSLVGYSLLFDNTNGIRATQGQRISFSQDFAGLGGDTRYIRTRFDGTKYWGFGSGWVLSAHAEGGYIKALQKSPGAFRDPVRLTDRFFGPDLRGFDIRGIGPRIQRVSYLQNGSLDTENKVISDSLGGKAYYMGRLELELPTSSGLKSMGLRPSAFIDIGSLFSITQPQLADRPGFCTTGTAPNTTTVELQPGQTCTGTYQPLYKEIFLGNSAKPRLSIGFGVNWVSPFGPFRIDVAKALLKQEGDDTKLFSFNVGTQF